jgi:hypothetical protein
MRGGSVLFWIILFKILHILIWAILHLGVHRVIYIDLYEEWNSENGQEVVVAYLASTI